MFQFNVLVMFVLILWAQTSLAQEGEVAKPVEEVQATEEQGSESGEKEPESSESSAQDSEVVATSQSGSQRVEKIEVTGSHIKRIDVEGPSPVLTIDNDALIRSGYNSVSDVLRDTGVNSFGSFREHAGVSGGGTSAVDLRGLGQVRTLVLLDGKRLPTDAANGAVDLNIIPMAAVERIEVLKDGASAIYGSDALGGVVNIITKKDFSGHQLATNLSFTELKGGDRRDLSHTYGYNTNRFRMINVTYFRHNERILAKDREWSKYGQSTYGSPGSVSSDGGATYTADPNCPADQILPSGHCGYNFGEENWELPYTKQAAMMNTMEYDITDSLTAFSRLSYSYKETDWALSPAFTTSMTVEDPDSPGDDLLLRYRFKELGNRESHTKTNAAMAMLGFKGYMLDTWEWESSLSFNRIDRRETRKGYALTADIQNAIDNGDFDPLAPEGQRGDLSHLRYNPTQNSISENTFYEAKTSGELGNLGAGPVSMAVGVQAIRELYRDGADEKTLNGEVLSIANSAGGGSRNSASLFTEFNFQFLQNLETVAALRYDNYEGFGDTVNPKLAFRYLPIKELMIRTSAGTGFKAPQMQRLYSAQTSGFQTFVDQVHCDNVGGTACNPTQHPVVIGGNPNLHEEKSFSFNFGTVFQPNKYHNLALDFWYYDLRDAVQETDYGAITRAQASGANIADYGATSERNPTTGELIGQGLYAPYLNISSIETQGIDLTYDGRVMTSIGDFRLNIMHSHMIYYKTESFPGTGVTDLVGGWSKPQWRNNTTLFYNPSDNHEFSLLARTIAENQKVKASAGKHPTYTEFDLRYNWNIASWNSRLTLGIQNLLGTTPPYDDSVPTDADINYRLYSERMRAFFVGYRYDF